MLYIDIHTHHYKPQPDTISVESIYDRFTEAPADRPISAGLHPWYLHEAENQIKQLSIVAQQPNTIAIGECGLDKLTKTDWQLQLKYFELQLQLAENLQKPVVIHCVKAFTETLALLKGITIPVIFHGINNKLSIIAPLINNGYFLSFGKSLLSPAGSTRESLNAVPPDQLFLETDDTNVSIKDIYKSAAEIRNITENEIALQLQKNFHSVFNYAEP